VVRHAPPVQPRLDDRDDDRHCFVHAWFFERWNRERWEHRADSHFDHERAGIGSPVAERSARAADFDKAQCALASPYDDNGGLRIAAVSSESPGSNIVIVGSSVAHDGDFTWTPDGTRTRIGAPVQVNVSVPQGVVFTGSTGGTTTLHVEAGGRRGTATFQGATYVSATTVTDAVGTISWTCNSARLPTGNSKRTRPKMFPRSAT
jgi:hypothetical protein